MPVFRLNNELVFPSPELAREDGILAIDGDLSPDRILLAYSNAIFPWYSKGEPIVWWSPDPRFVLFPQKIKISYSLKKEIKRNKFEITYDKDFRAVITNCQQSPRKNQNGTWITNEMLEAYCKLNQYGYAHSIEAWFEGTLAGGFYGVSLGRCFMGESMFTKIPNASKVAFATLVSDLIKNNFYIIDSQVYTEHMNNFGAENIPRSEYLKILSESLEYETIVGNWGEKLR
jgi:leucyl/phenylalanyl-tRNA--protein transferase